MTYKIDKKLPWFEARAILKEDMYVNIISESHSEELNPNGLFSGFLSGCIFFTSRWNGFEFEPLEIRLEDINQVLFLEALESEKEMIEVLNGVSTIIKMGDQADKYQNEKILSAIKN